MFCGQYVTSLDAYRTNEERDREREKCAHKKNKIIFQICVHSFGTKEISLDAIAEHVARGYAYCSQTAIKWNTIVKVYTIISSV